MTQEQKDLLLKDLCARLPYGVICEDIYGNALELNSIDKPNTATFKCSDNTFWATDLDKCKPYLFPLSSMSDEQKVEYDKMSELDIEYTITQIKNDSLIWTTGLNRFNWLLKNHFDVYDLIPMGLAIDATNLNIY